jgi:hypothetical protein
MVGKKSTDDTIQELKEYLDKATKN